MADAKSTDEDDQFFNATDEFPFYDCPETFESSDDSSSPPQSTLSLFSSSNSDPPQAFSVAGGLLRRRSAAYRERNRKLYRDLKDNEREGDKLDSDRAETTSDSVIENVNVERNEEDSPPVRESDGEQFGFLVFLAELIVKAIGFQFNLLINFVTFPFWALYYCCMLAVNPFYVVRFGRDYLIGKLMRLWNLVSDAISPFVSELLKEHKSLLNFALRCGWGLFWSVYVCSVLVALLISAFVISGLIMRYYLVEQPFQLKQGLNFDFTKSKPVAFVPITVCPTVECAGKNEEAGNDWNLRVIPPNHKLKASVTLIVPESDYNRNLGIFQVRVDYLSDKGKSLASLSHPCMLEFRSEPIRLLLTFFKIVPLVAGYVSESQTLNLKFRGYNEGVIPTACLKVTIEQRAEFRAGAGIPEIYDALVHLESELPFLKRFLWYWKKTIFVWLSMMLFMVELLFGMVCCRHVIIPRARSRDNAARTSHQPQR